MHRFFLPLVVLCCLIYSCGNADGNDPLLNQAPYDKLTDSIRQSPADAGLYYKRGVLFYQNEKNSYAEQDIRKAWTLSPKEEYALGLTRLLREKNSDSAVRFLEQAVRTIPKSIALQISLARGYQQQKKLQEALKMSERLVTEYPDNLDAAEIR